MKNEGVDRSFASANVGFLSLDVAIAVISYDVSSILSQQALFKALITVIEAYLIIPPNLFKIILLLSHLNGDAGEISLD
jgi:hypothetical protein